VLLQRFEKTVVRHWRRHQHALTEVAAHHHQGLKVGDAVDPLRDRHTSETVSKIDCGLADRGIGDVDGAILHERAMKLELGYRIDHFGAVMFAMDQLRAGYVESFDRLGEHLDGA
jgi:hypothetical protein